MIVIALNQQDANDLLGMICNDQVVIASSRAARVHQLQALLSSEPVEYITLNSASDKELEAELARRGVRP